MYFMYLVCVSECVFGVSEWVCVCSITWNGGRRTCSLLALCRPGLAESAFVCWDISLDPFVGSYMVSVQKLTEAAMTISMSHAIPVFSPKASKIWRAGKSCVLFFCILYFSFFCKMGQIMRLHWFMYFLFSCPVSWCTVKTGLELMILLSQPSEC